MKRSSPLAKAIYKHHQALFRYLNDVAILGGLIRPTFTELADDYEGKGSKKREYAVPSKLGNVGIGRRSGAQVAAILREHRDSGFFASNLVNIVSRFEALVQQCIVEAVATYPAKLSLIRGNSSGIPLDLFEQHDRKEDILSEYISARCEAMMFGNPKEYLGTAAKVLSIVLDDTLVSQYIEIKATRDLIVHNDRVVNRIYAEKAGDLRRGAVGERLPIDLEYFQSCISSLKTLSRQISDRVAAKFG